MDEIKSSPPAILLRESPTESGYSRRLPYTFENVIFIQTIWNVRACVRAVQPVAVLPVEGPAGSSVEGGPVGVSKVDPFCVGTTK